MFKWLFNVGVQPEALLLPKRPDQGRCRLCEPELLQALIDVLSERCNGDLSPHKEVIRRCQPELCCCYLCLDMKNSHVRA